MSALCRSLYRVAARTTTQRSAMTVAVPASMSTRRFAGQSFWEGMTQKKDFPTSAEREGPKVLEEIEAAEKGVYYAEGPVIGKFGTMAEPANIFSHERERTVGCVGDNGSLKHPLMWMSLKFGLKHVCTECGQVFNLVNEESQGLPEVTPAQEALIVD